MDILYQAMITYPALLFSLCVHEWAHAFVAKKKGDWTAYHQERCTLNPIAHIDWIGTVILPLLAISMALPVFGWAKPVPVQEANLKNPKSDLFWIALAGPLSNFFLAIFGGLLFGIFHLLHASKEFLTLGYGFVYINLLLAIFNLIPLHPLDGGKVIARFLSAKSNQFLENMQTYSSILLIGFFIIGGFRYIALPALFLTQVFTHWPNWVF